MKKLYGTVVPLITPLLDDDSIDTESLCRLCDHVIDGGLQCLYPCGTTGEMMYLSVAERKLVAETVVRHAAGRVPVFVQTGAWNLADTIELSRHAVKIGADGIGVVTPVFYKLSDQGLIDFYKAVASSVPADFSVYLYAIPQNAVNDITPAVAEAVAAECPNVVGIKYSWPDFTRLQQFMLVRNQTFSVLVGPDHLFEAVCAVGGEGVVSGNAMCVPEHYAALWQAIQAKDFDLATKLQRRTNVLNALMCEINNIAAYKVILKDEGVIRTSKVRRPMENLTAEQEKQLLEQLHDLRYREIIL
ncbi:MAG: dihydrodipicolinate synthase family protein [Solobacterium sp.]|nr:dihydrodipicolinate synthase family protein [Solobacterium sp.]MBQ1320581.1 dihydrodipicolinate synthase family protein [Solobacterium sp.]MBQ1355117.1 dihydrodipicolinate synthase family protein [Solobacterium sp.]